MFINVPPVTLSNVSLRYVKYDIYYLMQMQFLYVENVSSEEGYHSSSMPSSNDTAAKPLSS